MLSPCPSCARHVAAADHSCPFCGASTEGARPGPVRLVSRRELTRAAIFAGAALFAGACGGPEITYDNEEGSSGGDSIDGDGFAHDSDDGSGGDSRVDRDEAARREALAREEEERRRQQEEIERVYEERRRLEDEMHGRRRGGSCTPEGICPPYGAPPIRDALV